MSTAAAEIMTIAMRRQRRGVAVLWAFGGLQVLAFLLSVGWGAVTISPGQVLAIVADTSWILSCRGIFARREEAVLLAIRLPRTCLGMLAGSALAVSGASLQGLFRNPLADPALIGVSTGAALAAVGVIVLGVWSRGFECRPLSDPSCCRIAAFAGGLLTTLLVYRIAQPRRQHRC